MSAPAMHIAPVPGCEPPYDAEPPWERPLLAPAPHPRLALPAGPAAPGDAAPGPPPGGDLAALRFLAHYRETLSGRRPAAQLIRWSGLAGARCLARDRCRCPHRPHRTVVLHGHRITQPRPGVVEAVGVLRCRDTAWAVALRLEHRDDRWRLAHLESV